MYTLYKICLTSMLAVGIFPCVAVAVTSPLSLPDVSISSSTLAQADTLLVVVKNESADISGRLGLVKLHFFKSENGTDWIAAVGMPINKIPGSYTLVINVPGKQLFKKTITVAKRKFPITVLAITPKLRQQGYTAKKIIDTIKNQENISINSVLNIFNPATYAIKPFTYPLAENTVMGDYGDIRKSGNLKIQHLGVDLKAPLGTPVLAVNDGRVVFTGILPDYGNTLIIDHGIGVYSLYLHLSGFSAEGGSAAGWKVQEGQMVKQGDTVALSGDTGYVTGPHLHFSIKIRNASVDPLKFIEATRAEIK